jgi:5'(3')-deoxyribonucleotidase
MKQLTLLFDLDGMITDLYGTWLPTYNAEMAEDDEEDIEASTIDGPLHHAVRNASGLWEIMNREGFFEHLLPLPGGVEAVAWAHGRGHHCKILSSPGRSVFAPTEKTKWVLKHMPFLNQDDIMIANNKHLVWGDAFFDDSVKKIDNWKKKWPEGAAMGIAWPYNEDADYDLRADGWEDTEAAWNTLKLGIEQLEDGAAPNALPGGIGDKLDPRSVDPIQLAIGAAVEREHTDDPKLAAEIALDHLAEDPAYYEKLLSLGL